MIISHQKVWIPSFIKFSTLFFPIVPYSLVFSKFAEWPSIDDLNQFKPKHVRSFLSHNICFVEQKGSRQEKCFASLYEPRIFLQGEVSTRSNSWHDFFNALIWYTFPKIKAALNMRQFIAFDERADFPWRKPPPTRTREQDFLTMFDEGGCILVHIPSKNISLPFLFGHGFYERIAYGDRDLSASTLEITLSSRESCLSFPDSGLSSRESCLSSRESCLSFPGLTGESNDESWKEILSTIDNNVAHILSNRDYYKQEGAFRSVHLKELTYLLTNFLKN